MRLPPFTKNKMSVLNLMARSYAAPRDTLQQDSFIPEPIVGHHESQKNLRALYAAGKMPHGLLLHGPEGIGKRVFAENLAWGMICGFDPETPERIKYDERARYAPVMAHGAHAGFAVLEPESSVIKIDQVRAVNAKLSLADEGWRVVIVDAADNLNSAAANALLKTLEEPSGKTLLILISHAPSKLLPTLISRCRKVRLCPLATPQLKTVLQNHSREDVPCQIKEMADGAPGRALYLNEYGRNALEILTQKLNNIEESRAETIALAEELLSHVADAKILFDIILWLLADKARAYACNDHHHQAFIWGQCYQRVHQISADQQEYNLTPQLSLEKILSDIFNQNS